MILLPSFQYYSQMQANGDKKLEVVNFDWNYPAILWVVGLLKRQKLTLCSNLTHFLMG